MVRTLIEIQGGRVAVQETPEKTTVTVTVDAAGLLAERLYTAAEVGDAQASEAELVAAPLRRQVMSLGRELIVQRERNAELDTELANARAEGQLRAEELERQLTELKRQLAAVTDRAKENREWAERAEGRLASAGLKLKDAERTIQILSDQLGRISGAVHSPEVVTVLGRVIEGWEFSTLAGAVRKVRDALGSRSPAEPTSQA